MWYGAAQLIAQREERKILMVVTDGRPENAETVRDVVERCQASGIEVIGIGIKTPAVRTLFPTAVVIGAVSELRGALFDVVRNALLSPAA
jgi:cobalamin biosynthesis protein CobT